MRIAIIQYVLSAEQRSQGFSIESLDDNIIELCYKGKTFFSCSPFIEVRIVQNEIDNFCREYYIGYPVTL